MSETKYVVKFTTQFKKDFKLAMKRGFKMDLLEDVITLLAMGEVLPDKNKDHALTGNWVGHREYEIVGRMDSREDFLKNIQAEWGTTYVNG